MFDTEGRELKQLTGFSKGFDVGAFQRGKYIVILDFDFLYGTCQFVPLFDLAGATVFDPGETVISRPFPFSNWALDKEFGSGSLSSAIPNLQPVPWVFKPSIYQILAPSYHTEDRAELN